MGNKESNESAAVKRQAEGGANPMYLLLDLSGISGILQYSHPTLNGLLKFPGYFWTVKVWITECNFLRESESVIASI